MFSFILILIILIYYYLNKPQVKPEYSELGFWIEGRQSALWLLSITILADIICMIIYFIIT